MSMDEASDVTKALAAFGAPAIRYRSFGQRSVQLSRVVVSHRDRISSTSEPTPGQAPSVPPGAAPSMTPPVSRRTVDDTVSAGALFINSASVVIPRQMMPPSSSVAASLGAVAPCGTAVLPASVVPHIAFAAAPTSGRRGLVEVFQFLAEGPEGAALLQREVPELLRKT